MHPIQLAVENRAGRTLAVTSIGVFVVFLDATIVNVAFEAMGRSFQSTTASLAWVLNTYSLIFAALLVPAGRLADQYGRKRVFQIGLVGFAATSVVCGLAPTIETLIAGRGLQAVFAAFLVPASLALLLPEFPVEKRATAIGAWGAVGALAAASGPTLGALVVQYTSWRWVFLMNVPICLFAAVAGVRVLRESRDETATGLPDPLGTVLVTAAVAAGALGIIQGPEWGWSSPGVLASFAAAAVGLPLFVARAQRAAHPVLDLTLFRVRSYAYANAASLTFALAFFAVALANLIFMQTVWGWSVLRSAIAITPSPVFATIAAPLAGRFADRYGHRAVVVPGALVFTAALLLYTRVDATPDYVTVWLPAAVLSGIGIGMTMPTLGSAAAASLPPASFAVGNAVNASFRQFGAVLGVSVFVAVLGTPTLGTALDSFHRVWFVLAAVSALTAVLCVGVRTPKAPTATLTNA